MTPRALRCLIAALVLAGPALAVEPTTGAEPNRDQVELQAMLDALVPLVEQQAGRAFHVVPELVLADPASLAAVLYDEQVHLLSGVGGMSPDEAALAAQTASSDMSTAFVGKYGFLDKKLYVMREGIHVALAARGVDLEEADAVTELVLAHELVHALQDQHVDLGAMVGGRADSDGVIAATCTVEGHAVWVQEQVGRVRGHDKAVREVAAILGYDPSNQQVSLEVDGFYTSYVYGQGRNFIDFHHRRDGTEGVWQILANPPPHTAMIMRPESYDLLAEPPFERRVRRSVDRARRSLSPARWRASSESLGDYDLRERLVASAADDLPNAWLGGWTAQANRTPIEWVEVELHRFDHDGAAAAYVALMARQAQADLAQAAPPVAAAFTGIPRVDGSVTPFGPMAGEPAAQQRFTFDFGTGGEPQVFRRVWVAHGAYVVQVVIVNHEAADRRVARAIRQVFRTLD